MKNTGFLKIQKILILNIFLVLFALLGIEFLFRIIKISKSCLTKDRCNFSYLYKPASPSNIKIIGLTKFDKDLGWVPRENFSKVIFNPPSWINVKVSIDKNGFRKSAEPLEKFNLDERKKILTVGDSFTFGDQVSNNETWQYYLNEKQQKYYFINGGMGAYGTAQSIKRASLLKDKLKPDINIVAVTVGLDFERDKYKIHSGFPRPALITENGKIFFSDLPDKDFLGSRYSNKKIKSPIINFLSNSYIFCRLQVKYCNIRKKLVNLKHPKAASTNEIIKWSIRETQKFEKPVIWLLLYGQSFDQKTNEQREFLIKLFKKNNIKYIDTYDQLLVYKKNNQEKLIWFNHFTPYANNLVSEIILETGKF